MARLRPIFKAKGRNWQAYTCRPLTEGVQSGEIRQYCTLAHGGYPGKRLGRSELPGVSSVGFWDIKKQLDWGLDWHRNEGIELLFLESGRLELGVDHQSYVMEPNDLAITRPWQLHRFGEPCIGPSRLHWIILDVGVRRPNQAWNWPNWLVLARNDIADLTDMLRHHEEPIWRADNGLAGCFRRISAVVGRDDAQKNISHITVYLNEAWLLVLDLLRQRRVPLDPFLSSTRRTVQLFFSDIRQNPHSLSQAWTLEDMADQCGLSTPAFVQHCKQLTNMTPMKYLNSERVKAAAEQLIHKPELSISRIAMDYGFGSSQYFATVFRRHLGCSPGAYRKQQA